MNFNDELLLAAVRFKPEWLPFTAWAGHIPFAHYLIRTLKPKNYVELGTHFGASYFAFCQTIKEQKLRTQTFAIDTWQGDAHAGRYDDSVYQSVLSENEKYSEFSTLLRGTFDEALEKFEDGSIELLHIDGFHTYEAVKHDFESWFPKLAKGATVLFHDTYEFKGDFGVYRFWEEVTKKYEGFEFQHSHGLGVLQLPGAKVKIVPPATEVAQLTSFFSNAGAVLELEVFLEGTDRNTFFKQVRALRNRVNQLEKSTSWKVTAPLRAVSGWFKGK